METRYSVAMVDYDPMPFDLTPAILAEMEATLAEVGAALYIGQYRTASAVVEFARTADLVMIQTGRPLFNREVIAQLSQCRAIIRMGVGYDSIDVAAATERGILVSNVVDWCYDEVADHTAALVLAGLRRVGTMDRDLHRGVWDKKKALDIGRLWGKTLGILGFGRVGQAVARRMAPFGFQLVTYDPYLDRAAAELCGVTPVSFDDLITQSDVISIHARLTSETYHLLGAAEFTRMKPGAFVVNTARGAIIDEPALIEALRNGQLSGAALDVMETEPLPSDSPLAGMENVLLTPHLASFSREAAAQLYERSAEVAAALLAGQWTKTIVNPQVRAVVESRFGPFRG